MFNSTMINTYFKNDLVLFCFSESQENQFIQLYKVFLCFVNPILALFGQAMNILCMAILKKSGLGKSSNILLFALTLADSMNLIHDLNFGHILRFFGPDKFKPGYCTWEYNAQLNMFLYVSQEICFIYWFLGTQR